MSNPSVTRVTVNFTDPEEFLDEVRKDHDRVERGILRLTVRRRYAPPFVHVAVVATAVVGRTVVRLEHRVGEAFFGDGGDHQLTTKTQAVIDTITEAAKTAGLEARAGVYE